MRGSVSYVAVSGGGTEYIISQHWDTVVRILREQFVKEGRAGAAETGDDDGRLDLLVADLGVSLHVVFDPQTVREKSLNVGARDEAADECELGLLLERAQQDA